MASIPLNLSGGKSDKKEYRLLTLEGGFEVLLISNREVQGNEKKCAAAMACEVGSFSDPTDIGGLAHFLEHMLFMGSDKYPGENEYDKFISDNGGYDNAFTEGEHTVYNFEIGQQHFDKALDIFAQSFISATLLEHSAKREMLAIENEFNLARMSDSTRLEEVIGDQAHENHFLHKFGWGNLQSLEREPKEKGVDVMAALRDLYRHHYRPERCKLVVLSSQPLVDMEQVVRRSFGNWAEVVAGRDAAAPPPRALPGPMSCSEGGGGGRGETGTPLLGVPCLHRISPIKANIHELKVLWVIPPILADYKGRCAEYVGHLIGHEAGGSILSALRRLGLATDITAGVRGLPCVVCT